MNGRFICDARCPLHGTSPDVRTVTLSPEVTAAVLQREPVYILGRRYVCDDDFVPPEPTYTEAEARAMRKALRKLDRSEGRR